MAAGAPTTTDAGTGGGNGNWLSSWRARTPPAVRYTSALVIAVTLLGTLLSGARYYLALLPDQAIMHGQVWRLVTCLLEQGGILTLLVVVLLYVQHLHTNTRAACCICPFVSARVSACRRRARSRRLAAGR